MNHKFAFVGAGFVGVALLGFLYFAKTGVYVESYADGRTIPLDGLMINPHPLDQLQGDTKDDFQRLHRGITQYIKARGEFPNDPRALIEFTKSWNSDQRITKEAFCTSDYKKSDFYTASDDGFCYQWDYRSARRDGKQKPIHPNQYERDVWLSTDIYVRRGQRIYRDGTSVTQPSGHYLVLWSNGQVEEVPLASRLKIGSVRSGFSYAYQGEAGVPKSAFPSREDQPTPGKWYPLPEGFQPIRR